MMQRTPWRHLVIVVLLLVAIPVHAGRRNPEDLAFADKEINWQLHDSAVAGRWEEAREALLNQADPTAGLAGAIRHGDMEFLAELLLEGADEKEALILALRGSAEEVVRYILDGGYDVETLLPGSRFGRGDKNLTLLMGAARSDPSVLQAVLEFKPSVDTQLWEMGPTALWLTVTSCSLAKAHLLLQAGSDPEARSWRGKTALDWARNPAEGARCDDPGEQARLVALLENPDGSHSPEAEQPEPAKAAISLHQAAETGNTDAVGQLLEEADLDAIEARDGHGRTPLHLAASAGHAQGVALLLDSGADPNAKDAGGFPPVYVACEGGHGEALTVLIDAGAALDGRYKARNEPVSPGGRSKGRRTLLHVAARHDHAEVCEILVDAGMDPDARDSEESTPLHLCAESKGANAATALLAAGASVDPRNRTETTPLYYAAYEDNLPLTQLLLKEGADPNAATRSDFTPLMEAARKASADLVVMLLDAGAEVHAKAKDGTTAMEAARYKRPEILEILSEF